MDLEQKAITSLEVAEMMELRHGEILRKLEGDKSVKGIIPTLTEHNFVLSDYFSESTYQDTSGKENKCYLVTKLGCDFLANKFTGEKGILFTAKYVKRFREMEIVIETNLSQLPPSLQVLQGMVNQMIQQELRNKQVEQKADKAIETSQAIKDTIVGTFDNWREEIKHLVSSIQRKSNLGYQEVYSMIYDDLEKRAKCDLSARVRNLRSRLQEAGASKTKIESACRMDAIEADPRLKEIFTTVVKEYSIKYVA